MLVLGWYSIEAPPGGVWFIDLPELLSQKVEL